MLFLLLLLLTWRKALARPGRCGRCQSRWNGRENRFAAMPAAADATEKNEGQNIAEVAFVVKIQAPLSK